MTTTLLVMTDGRRDCILRTIPAALLALPTVGRKVIHDDSGDPEYADWLEAMYAPDFEFIHTPARSGFGGAIQSAWSWLLENDASPYIFHLEDDFILPKQIPLEEITQDVLPRYPNIMQMAFLRQAWNPAEVAAGGVIPNCGTANFRFKAKWIEHRDFITTNPCVYRRELMQRGWPRIKYSEGYFSIALFNENPAYVSAYWGKGEEWVEHIGRERLGVNY